MLNQLIVTIAFAIAGAVWIASLYVSFYWLPRRMERAYQNALRTLATAVETKDSSTLGHAERVAEMAAAIAARLGLPKEQVKWTRYGALLRDIGKAAVPHHILNKESGLTDDEMQIVRSHSAEGAEIVSQIPFLAPLTGIIRHHHERWDGSGYPEGLAANTIPLISRIIGLVDDYEAMTSERPYHKAVIESAARRHILAGAGTLYDPAVVRAFLEVANTVQITEPSEEAVAA